MSETGLNILVLSHNYPRDKNDHAGLFIHTLNKSLQARGYRFVVISPHAAGLEGREVMDGIEVTRFRYMTDELESLAYHGTMHEMVRESLKYKFIFSLFLISFLLRTIRITVTRRIDLIHAHWWFPSGFIAYIVSFILRVPYVLTIHGTDAHIVEGNPLMSLLFKKVVKGSPAVVAGSEYLRKVVSSHLGENGIERSRVRKIPMPAEVPSSINEPAEPIEPNEILSVARLTAQKNLKTLVKAMGILQAGGTNFHAIIIGDGPQKSELEHEISRAGIASRVRIISRVDRTSLFGYYRRCAVFVLPSVKEGLGLVLAEALLMKAAVITSNSGGGTEIIEDNVSGLLFDPGSEEELARAIEKLLGNPGLAKRLSEAGYEKARKIFTPDSVSEKYAMVYHDAIA